MFALSIHHSTGQLGLFYLIFYVVLAAMFAICMQALLSTLTHEHPKWQLEESRIGTNPGLGFRPIHNDTDHGSLIWYETKSPASIRVWTKFIDEFLMREWGMAFLLSLFES